MPMTIAVLGAGAIGVSTALYLQRDGHNVVLIDRDEPGKGCSYGNAGLIQCSSILPVAAPGVIRSVPRMLLDPDQPLVIRWRHLPSLAPYLLRFLVEAGERRASANADALAAIVPHAYSAYAPLITDAGLQDLVRHRGELHVFKSRAVFEGTERGRRMRRERGIEVRLLDAGELHDLEPALSPDCRWGVLLPAAYQTMDPFRFIAGLARNFTERGGTILKSAVQDVLPQSHGGFTVRCDAEDVCVDAVVIALGAFSGPLARRLGSPTPLNSERGYHVMLTDPGISVNHTLISGDYRFAVAPMDGGVRLAGTAELAKVGAAPHYGRAKRLIPLAQNLLPGLRSEQQEYWMGHRPSLPDSVPVISPSPRHRQLYFAFGHGHSGLTLGGMTGRMIADMVACRPASVNLAPYSVTRFQG